MKSRSDRTIQSLLSGSKETRGRRVGALVLTAAIAACLLAPSVWAANIVDVRVGHHADYTRVVFELDAYVGYQIEQHGSDLVIALNAAAQPVEITPSKGLIESVEIAHSGKNAVAYLQLGSGGLKIKEMTLANPPRIVIDVLVPRAAPAAIAEAPPQSLPTPAAVTEPTPDTFEAQATPSIPTPPQETAAKSMPEEIEEPTSVARAVTPPPVVPSARRSGTEETGARQLAARTPQTSPPGAKSRQPATSLSSAKKTTRTSIAPSKSRKAEAKPFLGGPTTWAAAGVGIVLLVAAGIVIKRRSSESEFDDEEFEDGLGDSNPFADLTPDSNVETPTFAEPGQAEQSEPAAADSNFASALVSPSDSELPADSDLPADSASVPEFSLSPDSEVDDPDQATEPVPFGQVVEPLTNADAETAVTAVVEDSDEATEPVPFGQPVDMGELDNNETLVTSISDSVERKPMDPPIIPEDDLPLLHGAQIPESDPETATASPGTASSDSLPTAAVGSIDVPLLLKEIERRMAGIESRIDEIADGRERVERQVSAQTEELRVQRAAIARTQRAVRNMSRPEDAAPTEPALRDPKTPEGPRQE